MLHSGKARINHERATQYTKSHSLKQFEVQSAAQLLSTGAPLAHIEHMISKGRVINDL